MHRSIGIKNSWLVVASSVLVIVLLGTFFAFRALFVKADTALFYPSSCLGGWTNPQYAEGKPDVSDNTTDILSTANSAVLPMNTVSDLFCGGFKGEIPEESYAKKILLTFSWDVVGNTPLLSADAASSTISGTDFASSSGQILDAQSQTEFTLTTSSTPSAASTSVPIPSTTTVPSVELSPVPTPASSTVPTSDTSPQSSIFHFFVPEARASNEFLEVLYTVDGTNWKSLGTVDAEHLRYSVFEIPLPASTTSEKWSDLSNIQIDVKSLSSIDHTPSVYLDGMSLQVTYGVANDTGFVSDSGLYIPEAHSLSSHFDFHIRNNQKIEELVVSASGTAPIGDVVVFNASTSATVLTTFVDGGEYVIQPEYFGKGNYIFIETRDPNDCALSTLDLCRASADYVGEGQFTVTNGQ